MTTNNINNDYLQPIDNRQAPIVQLFPNEQSVSYNRDNDNENEAFQSAEEEINDSSIDDNNNNNNDNRNDNNNNNDNTESDAAVIGHTSSQITSRRHRSSYYDEVDEFGNPVNWPRGDFTSDSDSDECTLYAREQYASYATVASVHSKMS